MKISLRDQIEQALPFLPYHRQKKGARSQSLNLDQLLDESRSLNTLHHGSLDFLMMGYRYWHFFETIQKEFSSGKKLRPEEMADLWALAFAALLTRDHTPHELLVNDAVEISKKRFGSFTGGVTNAFLRKVSREKETLKSKLKQQPEILLGEELLHRWKEKPSLLRIMGQKLLQRPQAGVGAFDREGRFFHLSQEDFFNRIPSEPLQSINPGSWALLGWMVEKMLPTSQTFRILDACAAPGGKTLGLWSLLKKNKKDVAIYATDSKFQRLETLKSNVTRWKLSDVVQVSLLDWAHPEPNALENIKNFSPTLFLADLPCSGLGTLHTRPDLLQGSLKNRVEASLPLQEAILKTILKQFSGTKAKLFVSICSVDPYEISHISNILKKDPDFSSLETSDEAEGLYGWEIIL